MKGFTLLLTLIIVSAFLVIGLGVFDIVFKEIRLSEMGYDSRLAFYAANSISECILYWDIKKGPLSFPGSNSITCFSESITINFEDKGDGTYGADSGWVNFGNEMCAGVFISKTNEYLTIISRGYNSLCGSFDSYTVERGILINQVY